RVFEMAHVFIDGFDKYGAPDTGSGQISQWNLMVGDWTSTDDTTRIHIVAPLSQHGQAFKQTNGGNNTLYTRKTIPAVSRVIGGVRFNAALTGGGSQGIGYFNGT